MNAVNTLTQAEISQRICIRPPYLHFPLVFPNLTVTLSKFFD